MKHDITVNLFHFASDLFSRYSQGRNFHEFQNKSNERTKGNMKNFCCKTTFHQQNVKINSRENK